MTSRSLSPLVRSLLEHSLADNTKRSYGVGHRRFAAWCEKRKVPALPSSSTDLAEFLASLAASGLLASTVRSYASSIRHHHLSSGHADPLADPLVKAVLGAIWRRYGTESAEKDALLLPDLLKVLEQVPDTTRGLRDRAMLSVCFAAALRRSELVNIRMADLTVLPGGVVIRLKRSKTDQNGSGSDISIVDGEQLKPVSDLRAWLQHAKISNGPVFRPVYGDVVATRPVSPSVMVRVVKTYAARAGLDPDRLSSHSLRAGFITGAFEHEQNVQQVMMHTRHKKHRNLRRYIRGHSLFVQNPGRGFL